MATALVTEPTTSYVPIPLTGLAGRGPVVFQLYLRTAAETWVLYRDTNSQIGEDHIERLLQEGVEELFIRPHDRHAYLQRIERSLGEVLNERRTPVERRVDVLHGVAVAIADDVLAREVDTAGLARAQRMLVNASGLVLREQGAFAALRTLLGASHSLAQHSVTVAFLAMGLARGLLSADPTTLVHAGLGGLFHDIGRVGYEELEHDPEHPQRGYRMLQRHGVPAEVATAALQHHERWDGSGFPGLLRGDAISPLARLIGIVDVFDEVYSAQKTTVGVFDALRILAQAYRGCFEERLATHFVRLFR
jgi:putative nucleotidyltransferase with HDIG domain